MTIIPKDAMEKPTVILMQYQNERHEPIYAYVRVQGDKAAILRNASAMGELAKTSLGRVVASGRGEPSDDTRAIIAENYDCFCRYVRMEKPAQHAMA